MFLYSAWRNIPLSTRITLATQFGVKKIGPTHVRDNYVESDGYKIEDIEQALNVDALQKYLGTEETDMFKLMEWTVAKAEGKDISALVSETTTFNEQILVVPEEIIVIAKENSNGFVVPKKKRGRPAKAK